MPEDYRALLADTGPGTLAGVLRLLAPGGPDGFDMQAEQSGHARPHPDAQLWGVFHSGETCWWLPIRDNPRRWLLVVVGTGRQQLNITTTDFLRRWADGHLDLPVLSLPPTPCGWMITPAGEPVPPAAAPAASRDPLAQLATIIGPGSAQVYNWPAIEQQMGIQLPADYKRIHEAYGPSVTVNGIFVEEPGDLLATHTKLADSIEMSLARTGRDTVYPEPGGLLLCLTTEGRDLVCWDTRNPDPDTWPLVNMDNGTVFSGSLTQLLIAELTSIGLDLTDSGLGDPDAWAWPIWGPDEPW
jgi:hypothetical protein